jgi:hypothetical protein
LLDVIGTLQGLDLARDFEEMTLERRKIRACGRGRCERRRAAGRGLPGLDAIEFILARSDFCDRKIERGRAERR